MNLEQWGWTAEMAAEFHRQAFREGWIPGLVIRPGRGIFRLITDNGEKDARLTGGALGRGDAPVVGDWTVCREEGGTVVIDAILPRRTVVSRKTAGTTSQEQVLAANIDVLFVVQALGGGRGFTPRGIERYLAMAWESGCRPVLVINKIDLSDDPEADRLEAEALAPGVEICLCTTLTGKGVQNVEDMLPPGSVGAFVGPSGVGKSSLLNAIAGKRIGEIGEVRQNDKGGRHTTTHRELHRLDDGRLLVDTPGLRELQLWGNADTADAAFPEIERQAEECRFRDCRHEDEPGCAVQSALEAGLIRRDRFNSWLELRKELTWLKTRRDEKARKEYQEKKVKIAHLSRQLKKNKKIW